MDIKFDSQTAEMLICQMDQYCLDVHQNATELFRLLNASEKWNDRQGMVFQTNMREMSDDLNQILRLESEYMDIYRQRVRELKE